MNMANDFGAPVFVTACDIVTSEKKPTWNKTFGIAMSAACYLGNIMGKGGTFVKNVGIASAPWALGSIYEIVKGNGVSMPVSRRVTRRLSSSTLVSPGLTRDQENVSIITP